MDLRTRTLQLGGSTVLVLDGELDLSSLPTLHGALTRAAGEARGQVLAVDLDGLVVLDDSGLGVLLGWAGRLREAGGDLVLVCTNERYRERFDRSGLARAIEVRDRLG